MHTHRRHNTDHNCGGSYAPSHARTCTCTSTGGMQLGRRDEGTGTRGLTSAACNMMGLWPHPSTSMRRTHMRLTTLARRGAQPQLIATRIGQARPPDGPAAFPRGLSGGLTPMSLLELSAGQATASLGPMGSPTPPGGEPPCPCLIQGHAFHKSIFIRPIPL